MSRIPWTAATPPHRPQGVNAFGTTAYEESLEETIDQRILQEEPDPDSAYGAPRQRERPRRDRVGGDDPDSIDAEDDWLGDNEVGDARAGRLVADDEGAHEDDESRSGPATSASTAPRHPPRRLPCTSSTRSPTSPTSV